MITDGMLPRLMSLLIARYTSCGRSGAACSGSQLSRSWLTDLSGIDRSKRTAKTTSRCVPRMRTALCSSIEQSTRCLSELQPAALELCKPEDVNCMCYTLMLKPTKPTNSGQRKTTPTGGASRDPVWSLKPSPECWAMS
jgi:hypothetical protein